MYRKHSKYCKVIFVKCRQAFLVTPNQVKLDSGGV